MSKLTLSEWAADQFRTPPSPGTLRKWAREGRIQPVPIKHGRNYYVEVDAQYCPPVEQHKPPRSLSLTQRIELARQSTKG